MADDEFDMEMAKSEEEKRAAANSRASKLWRTLRIASKTKLNLFDRIDDGNNLQVFFDVPSDENGAKQVAEDGEGGMEGHAENVQEPSLKKGIDSATMQEAVVK